MDWVCVFSCLFFCRCKSSCSLSLLYSSALCSFCIRTGNMNIFCQCKTCDVNRIQETLELWKCVIQITGQKCTTSDVPELLKLSNTFLTVLLGLNFSWVQCAVMNSWTAGAIGYAISVPNSLYRYSCSAGYSNKPNALKKYLISTPTEGIYTWNSCRVSLPVVLHLKFECFHLSTMLHHPHRSLGGVLPNLLLIYFKFISPLKNYLECWSLTKYFLFLILWWFLLSKENTKVN